jgi:hypothetical protein
VRPSVTTSLCFLQEYAGIEADRLERMEARLKADVLAEAEQYNGRILVARESAAAPAKPGRSTFSSTDDPPLDNPTGVSLRSGILLLLCLTCPGLAAVLRCGQSTVVRVDSPVSKLVRLVSTLSAAHFCELLVVVCTSDQSNRHTC